MSEPTQCDECPDCPPDSWRARLVAFLRGVREFRTDVTWHYCDPLIEDYDAGREWAHRVTLRRFDR